MPPSSYLVALLSSVMLLIMGNGLMNTLVPLRAKLEMFPEVSLGLLGSVYFIGMLAGTLATPRIVRRAGYIRAFAAFASLAIVAALVFPVAVIPIVWIGLRGVLGFAFAGLYAVIEAWLNSRAQNENRGRTYGLYQLTTFFATALGQMILVLDRPSSFTLFSAAAALFALAVLPLAFTSTEAPALPASAKVRIRWLISISPVGAVCALGIGAVNGSFWSLGPVYGIGIGLTSGGVANFMTAFVLGSAIAVWPVGRLSDWLDRRKILIACMMAGFCVEIVLWRGGTFVMDWLPVIAFANGSATMVLYALVVGHTNDRTGAENAVEVSSGLLFLYCVGAIVAPTLAASMMRLFGPSALFGQNALVHLILIIFTLWRVIAREGATRVPRPVATAVFR